MVENHHMKELMEMKIWFLWFWKTVKGKKTKVPKAINGLPTGVNDVYQCTWATYDEALDAQEKLKSDGIAFKVPKGYFFLDVDHKDVSDPFVQMLLARFNSYAEFSQSGNGIHIYGKCDFESLPTTYDADKKCYRLDRRYYMKNPRNDLELYIGSVTNRSAGYTGNAIKDMPLADCTQAVLTTLNKDMLHKPPKRYNPVTCGDEDAFDIVCNLRKDVNHEKFERLYEQGDITGYGSQSEADLALCSIIAFRTGNNPQMIDTIFRGSALMREKWERDDYRESTIKRAIEACNGTFHFSVMPRPDFVQYLPDKQKEVIVCTRLAKFIREHQSYIFVRDNGRQSTLRYVYENGCYRFYSDDMFRGMIKSYIEAYNEDLVAMKYISETFGLLTTDLKFVPHDALNSDENIINFENGILRLDTMEIEPHSPSLYSTIQIPCDWKGENTPTPVFDAYLDTLTNGDRGLKQLLLEFSGLCISNIKGYRLKKALFLVGQGDTGKSQLKSLVEHLIGRDNFISIDLSEIEARFGTSSIYGKRLAGSSDMSFMTVSELKTFKKCTGGDSLFAEFKGMNSFEFIYGGLLWFCMNRLPKFGGDDGQWVYDRIMQVECRNVIAKDRQDKMLLDKMYEERDGIVYKFVTALQQVIANGYRFSEPDSVIKARKRYMEDNNTVIGFFNECMVEREGGKIKDQCTTGRVFNVYKAWCADNNHGFAKTAREFREILASHLGTNFSEMTVRRGKGGTFYRAYTLSPETKELYAKVYGYDDEFLA